MKGRMIFRVNSAFIGLTVFALVFLVQSLFIGPVCHGQIRITREAEISSKNPIVRSLALSSDSTDLRKLIVRTSHGNYPYGSWPINKPRGYRFAVYDEGREFVYDPASDVQVCEKTNTALVEQFFPSLTIEEMRANKGDSKMLYSYYHPYKCLVWQRSYYCVEGTLRSAVYLSPSGYVVEFSRFSGELRFINPQGEVFQTAQLYDMKNVSMEALEGSVETALMLYKDGRKQNFSADGKIFAFMLDQAASLGYESGCIIFAFNERGQQLFRRNIKLNIHDYLVVSPGGDRILASAHHIGRGSRGEASGIASAKCLLLNDKGDIIREINALCRDLTFSESGKYLMINDHGKTALVLASQDGREVFRFDAPKDRRIVGLSINERSGLMGIIVGSGFITRIDAELEFRFLLLDGREKGRLKMNIPGHRVTGNPWSYSLLFNKDATKFAFSFVGRDLQINKISYGEIE